MMHKFCGKHLPFIVYEMVKKTAPHLGAVCFLSSLMVSSRKLLTNYQVECGISTLHVKCNYALGFV